MLEWTENYDDKDNTTYEAPGVYTDECGGILAYYRIKPVLENDQIKYTTEGSDEDLLPKDKRATFESLGAAKVYCEVNHAKHVQQCAAHQE